jgi:hypothetical protein
MKVRALVGSGDRIALFTLPFVLVGLILNFAFPSAFDVALTNCARSRSWC